MMVAISICIAVFSAFLLGVPVLRIFFGKEYRNTCSVADSILHGSCVFVGIGEAAYLVGVFGGSALERVSFLWLVLLAAGVTASAAVWLLCCKRGKKCSCGNGWKEVSPNQKLFCMVCLGLLALSVLFQMVFLAGGSYRGGDMTFETVETVLADGGFFVSNPMTGQPYKAGVPLRLQILCLPGMYAALCEISGLDPITLVGKVIPVLVLLGSYLAYFRLGRTLFGKNRTALCLMLLAVSGLFWCGGYLVSMDGFQLLACGYRGTAIRNGILIPFTLSMCLEKKYQSALAAILAEACMVWTLYGLGSCFFVAAVMYVLQWLKSRKERLCRK